MTDLKHIQMLDQMNTDLENTAAMVANYYNSLIAKGVPIVLAERMAADFNKILWEQAFFTAFKGTAQ